MLQETLYWDISDNILNLSIVAEAVLIPQGPNMVFQYLF